MIDLSARLSRRRILQGMGVFAASAMLPISILPASAAAPLNSDFLKVSSVLTGKKMLPAEFATALFSAFMKSDAYFAQKISRLRAYIDSNALPGGDINEKLKADHAVSDLAGLPAMLLTGWYLGIVGSGDNAFCVAYSDALANQEVSDVLRPPSYAYGAYGSWAAKPF